MINEIIKIRLVHGGLSRDITTLAHAHNSYQIIYAVSGSADIEIDGTVYTIIAPGVVLLNSFESHRIFNASSDYTRYIIEADTQLIRNIRDSQLSHYITCKNNPKRIICLSNQHNASYMQLLVAMLSEYNSDNQLRNSMLDCHFQQLLIMLYRSSGYSFVNISPLAIEIKEYIDINFINIDSLEELAAHFNISTSNLMHKFKDNIGYTTMSYIIFSKLSYSARLLATTDLSIKQVAIDSGYSDFNNYARQFRSMFRCSPKEYRVAKTHK